jgi:anion-transporting  ArsA/GET3 family ATPase
VTGPSLDQARRPPLRQLLAGRKVICCVGSGGVGKTTTSAALALRLAVEGQRVLVLTIDPARRLANALGLSALGNRETPISLHPLEPEGVHAKGTLHAMVLDLKLAWDDLIHREARTPEHARQVLANRLYQTLSTVLAGSLEYMATERVAELSKSGRYDVIVLDTPPTTNALDFLEAPDKLLDVLDNDAMRVLLGPLLKAGRFGLRFFALPSSIVLGTLAKFTGASFLEDVAGFLVAFEGLYDGFKRRAAEVKRLLASPEAAFVLVTSPSPLTIEEALFFHRTLRESRIGTAAVVVNRVQRDPRRFGGPEQQAALAEALQQARLSDGPGTPAPGEPPLDDGSAPLSQRLARTLEEQAALADLDRREIERLAHALSGVPLYTVPRLRKDVHDLAGLWQMEQAAEAPE